MANYRFGNCWTRDNFNTYVMKRNWIPVAVFTSIGILSIVAMNIVSIANRVDYEVISYQVQYLDSQGVTFRVMFAVSNPTSYNLEVWQQKYDVYVAGYKISEITSNNRYKLLADNMSVIPLDVSFKWDDLSQKIAPINSQSSVTAIGDLPVLIKGRFAAKLGLLQISWIPFRTVMPLADFLP